MWWVGVHGGAGETTLARLLPGSRAAGHAWPQPATPAGASSPRPAVPVVLLARSHWSGLRAAQHAATDWASGGLAGVDLLGLVIIADAPGKLPRPLRELAALVAGAVPRTWHLPWTETWRTGGEVAEATAPKEARRLLTDLRTLLATPTDALHGHHPER